MTEVDKGAWWIENNELNFDVPRLLANLGLPDTEENRERAVKMVQEVVNYRGWCQAIDYFAV